MYVLAKTRWDIDHAMLAGSPVYRSYKSGRAALHALGKAGAGLRLWLADDDFIPGVTVKWRAIDGVWVLVRDTMLLEIARR